MQQKYLQGMKSVTVVGLAIAWSVACTQHTPNDTEAEPSKNRETQAKPELPTRNPQALQTAAAGQMTPNSMPARSAELACQPLVWPKTHKVARRKGAGQMKRGLASADMAPTMGAAIGAESGGLGVRASSARRTRPSGAAGKSLSITSTGPVPGRPVPGTALPIRDAKRRPQRSGLLTAGEWRDLDHWTFWRNLFHANGQGTSQWEGMQKLWGLSLRNRVSLNVTAGGKPATNVSVYLNDKDGKTAWKARSDNQGVAHLYPQWYEGPFTVCAAVTGAAAQRTDIEMTGGLASLDIGLDTPSVVGNGLDVMFMVDTTGSMGDELSYLQAELRNVISRVQDKNANINIRTSVNFYRDSSDEYVVRPFAFTESTKKAREQIARQSANGGGDFPEAVDHALTNAIFEHKWREDARARILFLVLDAPPHQESKALSRVRIATRQAAEQGIRIIPIAGSGIDKPTEFLMRFLAVATGGTYAFLTDDSGIGNSHLKPTIGKHKVEKLNQLLVKIINRYAE